MTLIKTSILSVVATIFKVAYGFFLNKLIAVYIGPTGVGLFGQVQSLLTSFTGMGTAGFSQGLIKYVAEFRYDSQVVGRIVGTAFKLVLINVVIISCLTYLFRYQLATYSLGGEEYVTFVIWVGLGVSVPVLSLLLQAILNGLGEVRSLVTVTIVSNFISMVFAWQLVPLYGLKGAVLILFFTPAIAVPLASFLLGKSDFFSWAWIKVPADRESARKLGKFTLMAIASAVSIPVSHMFIRNYLGAELSWDAAGMWTAMWRISDGYLLLITMTLSIYYLPRLSSIKGRVNIVNEIRYGQLLILPMVVCLATIIFIFRDRVITLFYDSRFLEIRDLFAVQLVGDVLKIASWLYSYVIIAKAETWPFVIMEIVFSLLLVFSMIVMVQNYDLVGTSYAYAFTRFSYLIVVFYYFTIQCRKGAYE